MPFSDIVIVGGGVHGAALSFELARVGVTVTLLERHELASGASGGPGFRGVRANDRDVRELPLMRIAYDIWPSLHELLEEDPGFRRIGGLYLFEDDTARDPLAMARIHASIEAQNAHGIPTELIDSRQLRELEPGVSDTVVGAVYTPLDGIGDHTRTTQAYARAAARLGATVVEREKATLISTDDSGSATVHTSNGTAYRATTAVVVLANSYTAQLLATSFGVELPVWRYNPQMTPVRAHNGYTLEHLIGHYSRIFSAKTIEDGLVMLSGGRSGTWDELTEQGTADPSVAAGSLTDAAALFPALTGAELVLTDASRADSVSLDEIPIIDRVPTEDAVFYGTGWSGHGFAIAPAVAALLSEWILTGHRPSELAPFAASRFAAASSADELAQRASA